MIVAAIAGFLVGGIFGFFASTLILLMRQSRNEKLVARGEPPIRDGVRPPVVLPSAVLGAAGTAIAVLWLPLSVALLLGTALPVLLILVTIAVIGRQLRTKA